MKNWKQGFGFLFIFVGVFGLSHLAHASIGISPAGLEEVVLQGVKTEEQFYLSRSDTNGDLVFDVTVDNPELVDVRGAETVTIPAGVHNIDFLFDITAENLSLGNYEANINFIPRDKEGADIVQGGAKVINTLKGVVDFEVVVELPPEIVSASEFKVENFKITNSRVNQVVSFDLRNSHSRPLTLVRYVLRIYDGRDILVQEYPSAYANNYQPDEVLSYKIPINALAEGRWTYAISVALADGVEVELARSQFELQFTQKNTLIYILLTGFVIFIIFAGLINRTAVSGRGHSNAKR